MLSRDLKSQSDAEKEFGVQVPTHFKNLVNIPYYLNTRRAVPSPGQTYT